MSFTPTNFQDLPSTATPIDAVELNKLGTQHAAAVADSAAQVPGLVDDALSTDAVIRAAADTAVDEAITAEGGITDPTIAAALSDTASQSRGVLSATIVTQRQDPILTQVESFGKGGVVGTSGRTPIAIRFDDWHDTLGPTVWPLMRERGLPASLACISRRGVNAWFTTTTWSTVQSWVKEGLEIWSHGTDHLDPAPDGYAGLVREIETSKAELELQKFRVHGFAVPGTSPAFWDLYDPSDWKAEYARMLQATYPLIEAYTEGLYRTLPSDARYGLDHATISDGPYQTLPELTAFVETARRMGGGMEFMVHAGNLGGSGRLPLAVFTAFLDYLVNERDAGRIEIVTPSSLVFADPSSTRRLDLIDQDITKWSGTGVTVPIVPTDAQGRTGEVVRVPALGSAVQDQSGIRTRQINGHTLMMQVHARATSGTGTAKVRLEELTPYATQVYEKTWALTGEWQIIRLPYTSHISTDTMRVTLASTAGELEFADPHLFIA